MKFSSLVHRIAGEGSRAWDIHARALERRARGEDVILLSVGDPDFDTPQPIIDAAIENMRNGRTHYSRAGGERKLRQAVADHHSGLWGRSVSSRNVVVVPGVQCGLFCAAMCVLEPGDEVIVPEPMYVTYEAVIGAAGAKLVNVHLRPELDFHLNPDDLARAVNADTRAVLLNTPHNPTGAVASRETLEAVGEIAQEHDLWVIADEVYSEMTFERSHTSPVQILAMADRCISLSSLSKSHAMSGWRIGWMLAPEHVIAHLERLLACMLYGSPTFIQDAAVVALAGRIDEVERMREAYRTRRDVVCDFLNGVPGVGYHRPEGGMYVMLDTRATGLSGEAFANRLLDQENVSLLPGTGFGPSAAGHVRMTLTESEETLTEACRRIARFVERLGKRGRSQFIPREDILLPGKTSSPRE